MQFDVKAFDAGQGRILSTQREAADEAGLRAALERDGLQLLQARPRGGAKRSAAASQRQLLQWTEELQALLEAGLAPSEALDLLASRQKAAPRAWSQALHQSLSEGHTLSSAMTLQPGVFPPLLTGLVQAAETSSKLPEALARYGSYGQRVERLRQQMLAAFTYPGLLLLIGLAVAGFLLGYVVPRFAEVYATTGRPLPWASALLLSWGQLVTSQPWALGGIALAVAALIAWRLRSALQQQDALALIGWLPGLRQRLETLALARLYLTLGMLLDSGMALLNGLRLLERSTEPRYQGRLHAAAQQVAEGHPLSMALDSAALSSEVAQRLLVVGERSGRLGEMLARAAQYHETEVGRWLDRFAKLMEPLLMLVIGCAVGAIVVLLYMPVFELAGSLQ